MIIINPKMNQNKSITTLENKVFPEPLNNINNKDNKPKKKQ